MGQARTGGFSLTNSKINHRTTQIDTDSCFKGEFQSALCINKSVLKLREVKAVQVHDFVPYCHKVTNELLLRIRTAVDFSESPKLGV